jgi:hypothetical protein
MIWHHSSSRCHKYNYKDEFVDFLNVIVKCLSWSPRLNINYLYFTNVIRYNPSSNFYNLNVNASNVWCWVVCDLISYIKTYITNNWTTDDRNALVILLMIMTMHSLYSLYWPPPTPSLLQSFIEKIYMSWTVAYIVSTAILPMDQYYYDTKQTENILVFLWLWSFNSLFIAASSTYMDPVLSYPYVYLP